MGDGTNKKPAISGPQSDSAIVDKIVKYGYPIKHQYVHKTTGVITTVFGRELVDDLRTYDMCYYTKICNKHIPKEYLCASVKQRLELLAGLLDTDGCLIRKDRRYQFSTANETLKNDFVSLISTFGWRASIKKEEPKISSSGVIGRNAVYTIGFNPTIEIPCTICLLYTSRCV